jgi:cytoskeletal protein RodZ
MSQTNDNDQAAATQSPAQKDLVGDILRKERITRRITVETIARDLKLNVKYIKSLEANEYTDLPADPYVRVYLKSLAKYLSLDSEAILKQFYGERGMVSSGSTSHDSAERIPITMKQKEEARNPLLIVAIVLIALLAVFSFIAKQQGWISAPETTAPATSTPADTEFIDPGISTDSSLADSLIPATQPQPAIPVDTSQASAVKPTHSAAPAPVAPVSTAAPGDTTGQFRLTLSVVKDSVWIQVFSDGTSWKNVVYKGQSRTFSARDSFNVHTGNIAAVKFSCNDKLLSVPGKGVTAFKLDRTGIAAKWPLSQWNTIFKNRL